MRTGYTFKLVIAVLLSFFHQMIVSAMDDNAVVEAVFDVIPNTGTKSFKKEWGDFHCEFTYSCVGGTKEEYILTISKDNEDNYLCIVERPERSSYLYFHNFELKIGGGKLLDGILFKEDHRSPINEDEYIVNHEKNTVSDSANFKNSLHKMVAIFNKKGRTEL